MQGASLKYCYNYSPFGAPLTGRTYQQGKFDAKVVNLSTNNIINTTGWTTIFCTNPTTCTSPETAVTLTATGGKLRMQTNKRYAQAYYTFTTVPGRVYKVKYRLSGVTFGLTNTSIFAPGNPPGVPSKELYTSANMSITMVNNVDREMIFTATEASVRFYITRGWAPTDFTATVEEVSLDYLNITEVPSQVNTISCTSINENMVMLANSGVNTADMTTVANILNLYYNRTYTAAEYQAILSHCTGLPASYVLAKEGAEAASVEEEYRFGGAGGQERDDEIFPGAYTAEFWEYDSRLGRRWNVDPLTDEFSWQSPYTAFDNNPLNVIDPTGESGKEPSSQTYKVQKGNTLSGIAKENKTTVGELLKLNPSIKDKNKIYEGETLNLPPTPQSGNQTPVPNEPPVQQPPPLEQLQTPAEPQQASIVIPAPQPALTHPVVLAVAVPLLAWNIGWEVGMNIEYFAAKTAEVLSIVIPAEYLKQTTVKAKEHTKNKQKKNWNKHTKPRSGRSNTKNRQNDNWRSNPNKKK